MTSTSIRVQCALTAFRAALLVVLSLAWSAKAQSQDTDISGRIDVRDVDAAALLYAVAEAININLVAPVPKGSSTVSMSTEYSSVADLLQKLAQQVGMRGVVLSRRILVLSPCLHNQAKNTPPQAPGKFSLRMPEATLNEVFTLNFPHLHSNENLDDVAMLSRRVVLRLINVSREDALQAVSVAFGGELVSNSLGMPTDRPTGAADCPGIESAPLSHRQEVLKSLRQRESNCSPRNETGTRPCSPLEYFSLRQIRLRGYIEGGAEKALRRFAFVDAPDGILHVVKRGTYVGQDFGMVLEVSRRGIQLSEIIEDSKDGWVKSKVELRYWSGPQPSQDETRENVPLVVE